MNHVVILSGAGISAESGISTFRDQDGLWEGHDVMEVASPEGWAANTELVLDFYNQRRRQLKEVSENDAHKIIANIESSHRVSVITQNVDDLHERAGSSNVLHLHGELLKVRSTLNDNLIYDWSEDLKLNDCGEDGGQLRPHIVWFGEPVPEMDNAVELAAQADIFIIVGTSLAVYPAASLIHYVSQTAKVYVVDVKKPDFEFQRNIEFIEGKASVGMAKIAQELKAQID